MAVVFDILFRFYLILRGRGSEEFHFRGYCQMIGRHRWNRSTQTTVVWMGRFASGCSSRSGRICCGHCWTRSHSQKANNKKVLNKTTLRVSEGCDDWVRCESKDIHSICQNSRLKLRAQNEHRICQKSECAEPPKLI